MCSCCFTEAADGCSTKLCNWMTRFRRDGWTALQLAAVKKHVEVANVLLQHGADVNAVHK